MNPSSSQPPRHISHAGGVVRLLQLTDCHLLETPGGRLLGMDTDHSLAAVVRDVQGAEIQPDLLVVTGDLADDGSAAAYARLREACRPLCRHQFWLPGNHDDRAAMQALPDGETLLATELRIGAWQILMLDSQIPGEIGGHLGPDQLALLETGLEAAAAEGLYTLVCLHHPPLPIGCAWLDEQRVIDAEPLFSILERFPGARALSWGHIHQEVDRWRGDLRLLASPSTCVQFAPGSEDFRADDKPPGYRWLHLHPDGQLETEVRRVWGEKFHVNLNQRGYL